MIKLRILDGDSNMDLPGGLSVITGPYKRKREAGGSEPERYLKMVCCWFCRGRRGLWGKECRQPLYAGIGKEMDSLLEPPEGTQPCQPFEFSSAEPILIYVLQNCKIIYMCCFKTPGL